MAEFEGNLISLMVMTDAYKQTHWMQYPAGTKKIYSYLESRGGTFDNTVFFGLHMILKQYFVGKVIDSYMLEETLDFCTKVFGDETYFNYDGWAYICDELEGRLPLMIKAVPEGTVVPNRNVLMTVENTDEKTPWLTNFFEPLLLHTWYPITVATLSREIRKMLSRYTSVAGEEVSPFHLNDFGFRGTASVTDAGRGGSAHLLSFQGTDNLVGIQYAMKYYGAQVCGFSVMAAEHSTVTAYGRDNEIKAYENILDRTPEDKTVSIVCDSYDAVNAVDNIFGRILKEKILARSGKTVIRPDSGDPVVMAETTLELLWKHFGGHINEKGYKVLDPHVGVIYGDYIDYNMIQKILDQVVVKSKFAPSNIIFGMGGALLQKVNRDTQGMSFKCSAAYVDGEWRDVYKQPKTDPFKNSKRGRLRLGKVCGGNGCYETFPLGSGTHDELVTVFKDGELLVDYKFEDIRRRADIV